MHVHFNNTTTGNAPIPHAPGPGAKWQPGSQGPLRLSHIGDNSKETLNQSSSRQVSMKRRGQSNLNDSSRLRQDGADYTDPLGDTLNRNAPAVAGLLQHVDLSNHPTGRLENLRAPLDSKGTMEDEPWGRGEREYSPLNDLSVSAESPLEAPERAATGASHRLAVGVTTH